MFFSVLLQLMEVGQIGVNGLLAATLAEVFKNAFEIAQIQSPGLAENLAKEISGKIMNARIFVETYLAVCSKFHESVKILIFWQVFFLSIFTTDYFRHAYSIYRCSYLQLKTSFLCHHRVLNLFVILSYMYLEMKH